MKRQTIIERNAEEVRAELERGETVVITARYGRSDRNGGHVRAVDVAGRVLGRANGGGYDLRCFAMWRAVQGVLSVPEDQIISGGRFNCIYANFGSKWSEFFGGYGWSVETRETYSRRGGVGDYVVIISKK